LAIENKAAIRPLKRRNTRFKFQFKIDKIEIKYNHEYR